MMSPIHTWEFQSPKAPKRHYVISLYTDGRMACSCPGYAFKGDCYHLDLPSNVQRRVWELKRLAPPKRKPTLVEIFDNAVA